MAFSGCCGLGRDSEGVRLEIVNERETTDGGVASALFATVLICLVSNEQSKRIAGAVG